MPGSRHIARGEAPRRKRDTLCPVPGLGPIAAAPIPGVLPDIGTLERKGAAGLAGLAPHAREAGRWKGRSVIGAGRKPLPDAPSMPALVAMRFDPDLAEKCTSLRAAGKPAPVGPVAPVALTRKLPDTANALVKAHRLRTPDPA